MATLTLVLSLALGSGWLWLTAVIAYGFIARVATGPTLSPLGQLATRVLAPRLGAPRLGAEAIRPGPRRDHVDAGGRPALRLRVRRSHRGRPRADRRGRRPRVRVRDL